MLVVWNEKERIIRTILFIAAAIIVVSFHSYAQTRDLASKQEHLQEILATADFAGIDLLSVEYIPLMLEKLGHTDERTSAALAHAITQTGGLHITRTWSSTAEWSKLWNEQVERATTNIKTILENKTIGNQDRIEQIIVLGAPVIPYLLDTLAEGQGNKTIIEAADALLVGVDGLPATDRGHAWKDWAGLNRHRFAGLDRTLGPIEPEVKLPQ